MAVIAARMLRVSRIAMKRVCPPLGPLKITEKLRVVLQACIRKQHMIESAMWLIRVAAAADAVELVFT
ncbi:hypothetical protein GCM10009611_04590 [Arthrobacter roseus]